MVVVCDFFGRVLSVSSFLFMKSVVRQPSIIVAAASCYFPDSTLTLLGTQGTALACFTVRAPTLPGLHCTLNVEGRSIK